MTVGETQILLEMMNFKSLPDQRLHIHLHFVVDLNGSLMNISPKTSSNTSFILLNNEEERFTDDEENSMRQLEMQKHSTEY